jgi:hypothetical protein
VVSGTGAVAVVIVVVVAVAVAVQEAEHSALVRFGWFEAIVDAWEADNRQEEESRCFAAVRAD